MSYVTLICPAAAREIVADVKVLRLTHISFERQWRRRVK